MPKCPVCLMSTCDCLCKPEVLHTEYSEIGARHSLWLTRAAALDAWCKREASERKRRLSREAILGHVRAELDKLLDEIVDMEKE